MQTLENKAEAFADELRQANIAAKRPKSNAYDLIAKVKGLAKASRSLANLLQSTQLQRLSKFDSDFNRVYNNALTVLIELDKSLSCQVHSPSKGTDPLEKFCKDGTTALRQKQIVYATTMIELIAVVIRHATFLDISSQSGKTEAAEREENRLIDQEYNAGVALRNQYRQLYPDGSESFDPACWLKGFTHNRASHDQLPLAPTASAWFQARSPNVSTSSAVLTASTNDRVNRNIERLLRDNEDIRRELQEVKASRPQIDANLAATMSDLRAQIQDQAKIINKLNLSQAGMQKVANQSQANATEQGTRIQQLERDIDQQNDKVKWLETSHHDLKTKYSQALEQQKQLEASNRDLRQQNSAMKRQLAQSAGRDIKIRTLQQQVQELKVHNAQLQAKLELAADTSHQLLRRLSDPVEPPMATSEMPQMPIKIHTNRPSLAVAGDPPLVPQDQTTVEHILHKYNLGIPSSSLTPRHAKQAHRHALLPRPATRTHPTDASSATTVSLPTFTSDTHDEETETTATTMTTPSTMRDSLNSRSRKPVPKPQRQSSLFSDYAPSVGSQFIGRDIAEYDSLPTPSEAPTGRKER